MTHKIIIGYSLEGVKQPLKLTRKIYGYIEYSNNSKYKYDREGILSKIKYQKISRACVMIDKKDEANVLEQFKKLKIKLNVLDLELKKIREFK